MRLFVSYIILVTILCVLDRSRSQRRIINGENIIGTPKRYMAYLLKAPPSPKLYEGWMCGGAIVSPVFILTSAACVEDIEYMYAIAGYNKYVPANKIDQDECVKATKKKVVFTCVPKMYELDHEKVEKWSYVDIAAVKVESPYKFDATGPVPSFCSHVPDQIEISFETKHQSPETDCMVLGWGHKQSWRIPSDSKDYNEDTLKYSPTLILDKTVCKTSYSSNPALLPVIDKYMICTMGEGNIGSDGRIINKSPANLNGCGPNDNNNNNNNNNNDCIPLNNQAGSESAMQFRNYNYYNFKRRNFGNYNDSELRIPRIPRTRRNGICQNDHGGPLVTWVGGREVLIGVASVFLVNAKDSSCVGPYLHTSTQCNGAFLNCVLRMFDEGGNSTRESNRTRRYETPEMMQERRNREDINQRYRYMVAMNRGLCDLPPEDRGFDMIQRRISWMHHPDGPAQNELADELIERPQIPMNRFYNLK